MRTNYFKKIGTKTFFVFILFSVLFYFVQINLANPTGADVYYHLKISKLISEKGIIYFDPYRYFTFFKDSYADPHFLFHLFLIPFVQNNPIGRSKLYAALSGAFVFASIYFVLKKWKIKSALLFTILLLSSNTLLFRSTLIRPSFGSIFFLVLFLYLCEKRGKIAVFILSLAYFLFHSTSALPLLTIFILVFIIFDKIKGKKIPWPTYLYALGGLALGILIHPHFSNILYFIFIQDFYIAFLLLKKVNLNFGAELYPFNIKDFVFSEFLILILILTTLIWKFRECLKKKVEQLFSARLLKLTAISIFFLLLSFSQRFSEYFIPFALLFSATGLNPLIEKANQRKHFKGKRILFAFNAFCLVLLLSIVLSSNFVSVIKNSAQAQSSTKFKKAAEWLEKNTREGEIIFHSNWGQFPQLFFYNHHNYYIVGMDPTFMYVYDKNLYWKWRKITEGEIKENLAEIIKKDFKSRYVLLEKSDFKFKVNIETDGEHFEKVLEDGAVLLYKIK